MKKLLKRSLFAVVFGMGVNLVAAEAVPTTEEVKGEETTEKAPETTETPAAPETK